MHGPDDASEHNLLQVTDSDAEVTTVLSLDMCTSEITIQDCLDCYCHPEHVSA